MSTANTLIQVPWPKRINSDISPSMLAADETPVLRNVKTRSLPFDVRPRNGMVYEPESGATLEWATAYANAAGVRKFSVTEPSTTVPFHAFIGSDSAYMYVSLVNQQALYDPTWSFYETPTQYITAGRKADGVSHSGTISYPSGNPATHKGGTSGVAPYNLGSVYVDLTGATAPSVAWYDDQNLPTQTWGKPAYYDGLTFISTASESYTLTIGTSAYWPAIGLSKYYSSLSLMLDATALGNYSYIRALASDRNPRSTTAWLGNMTISNGSTAGTMSVSNATSLSGGVFRVFAPATAGVNGVPSEPRFLYNYRIKTHVAGTATVELDRPYGLGETTANIPNLAAAPSKISSEADLRGAPKGAADLTIFNDRLFAARSLVSATLAAGAPQAYPSPVGSYGGYYGNAIAWSKPGNWNYWPDQNFAVVDQDANDPVTGLCALGDKLIIFKKSKTFVMTGYDEESFQINRLSDIVGCPNPSGMAPHEGSLYFCNQDGVFVTDGQSVRSISAPRPGHGITALWNTRKWSRAQGCDPMYFWPTMAVTPDGHLVFCCQHVLTTTDFADNFVYDILNESWSEWGMADKTLNPIRVVAAPNGKIYGVHRWWTSEITNCWNVGVEGPVYDEYPTLAAGTATKVAVVPEVEVWFSASPGNTFRVNEMQVDHKAHYIKSASGVVTFTPWTIKMATDPDLVLGATEHSILARWVNSSGYDTTQPQHYSDRLPETFQREAQTFRVKFIGNTLETLDLFMKSWTLLALKFVVSTTRKLGVDNSAT